MSTKESNNHRQSVLERADRDGRQPSRLQIVRLPEIEGDSPHAIKMFKLLKAWLGDTDLVIDEEQCGKNRLVLKIIPNEVSVAFMPITESALEEWIRAIGAGLKEGVHRYRATFIHEEMVYTGAFPLQSMIKCDDGSYRVHLSYREAVAA